MRTLILLAPACAGPTPGPPSSPTTTSAALPVPANKYELGDVLQIAVPNMNSQARWFFTGDGNPQGIPINDPLYARVQTWGRTGLSGFASFAINGFTPAAVDADAILGVPATNLANSAGYLAPDTTPFHVVTDSAWSPVESNGTLNVPNRTTFSAGVDYTPS